MPRATTPSFVCELPLILEGSDLRRVQIRLDCARQVYNAVLGESLKRLALLRESEDYQQAQQLPKRTKEQRTARREAFAALDAEYGLRLYDLHAYATQFSRSWLGEHLDANTVQTVATRAYHAVRQYQFGVRGRPRFKGKGQFDSVEGKTNKQGIRWRDGMVIWGDDRHQARLTLRARIPTDDPVVTHALTSRIKYVRLVRRTLNGKVRVFVQLICAGTPYQKPGRAYGQDVIGIDPGPRCVGLAGTTWGAQIDLTTKLQLSRRRQRRLGRQIDRQRRANNPDNYLPDGRVLAGRKRWRSSQNQRDAERKLAEAKRKEAAHRTSLHGRLANTILGLGTDIRIEQNSYRSFQKSYGKAVGQAAPATFVAHLTRKAASAGGQVVLIPTSLRLSQTCLCGTVRKKALSLRVHRCDCGITVQRDVWSAYLARFCVAQDGPGGLSWHLDADQARAAWSGTEPCLPAASSPVAVHAFALWARGQQSASAPSGGMSVRGRSLPASGGGTEQIVGADGTMAREGDAGHARDASSECQPRPASRARRVASRTPRL